jgi:VWFA-related protein
MKTSTFLRISGFAAALATLLPLLPNRAAAQATAPAQTAPAQTPPATPPAGPTVASAVGAVTLPVTVVDDKGNPVKSLTAADMKLTDDGTEQKIQSFGPATPNPTVFGILDQTTSGQRAELGDERLGGVHFVDHILPGTQDTAFVIQYGAEVDLLADPTASANKLHDAINQLGSPSFGNQNNSDSGSGGDNNSDSAHRGGSGGTLYDAIYLAANEELKKLPGQHIIVLIGDGVDHGSQETMTDAVEAAQNAHTAIFAIYYKSEEAPVSNPNQNSGHRGPTGGGFPGGGTGGGYPGGSGGGGRRGGESPSEPHVDGRDTLEHMCSATGGYMTEGKRDKSDDSFNKLVALLHNQYTLTFVPTQNAADSSFQRLTLTTEKKGVYPLMQQGYTPAQ